MGMVGRKFSAASTYRYGFNGKENDNEVKGEGNQQDYGFRIYDPRLGRFLSEDPLASKFPYYTPYQFAGNKPIWATDLEGLEELKSNQSVQDQILYQTYQIKASITNTIIRLNPKKENAKLKEEFAKVGITDDQFIDNFHIRMRTIVTNTPPNEIDPNGSFTIDNQYVIEEKSSWGREFLEAAFDVLSTASVIPTNNTTGVFAARGGGQFFVNLGRASIGILYNARRLSTVGVNNALQGLHKLEDVMEAGIAFVGQNAKKIYTAGGKFEGWESADGLKRYRPSAYKKKQGKFQSNFEQRTSTDVKWDKAGGSKSNMHVDTDQGFNFSSENLPAQQPAPKP